MVLHASFFSGQHGTLLQTAALSHVVGRLTAPYSAKKTRRWAGKIIFLCAVLVAVTLVSAPRCLSGQHQDIFLFGLTVDGLPVTTEDILKQEATVGVPVRMVTFYLQWPSQPEQGIFPASSLEAIHHLGAVPCVTWEPMYYEHQDEHMIPARSILQGDYNPYIISFAQKAAAWGHPFILRLAHEMNIKRYHWGTSAEDYGPQSPGLYRKMFRHIVSVFQDQGADNVLFTFCPNAESVPNTSYDPTAGWNTISAYYPGDAYVHILGLDGYNWGTTQTREHHGWTSTWQSFADIFANGVHRLRMLNDHKPLIIFETGSAQQGGDRDEWLVHGLKAVHDWNIEGLSWFQVDKEVDWKVTWKDLPTAGPRLRQMTSPVGEWISGLGGD